MTTEVFINYLSRLMDHDLSQEEFAELERHLASSPEARARYREYVNLHSALDLEFVPAARVPAGASEVVDIRRIIRRQRRKSFRIAGLSAAAATIIAALILTYTFLPDPPLVTLSVSPQTDFTLTHDLSGKDSSPEEMALEIGSRLQVNEGTVELKLRSGVRGIVRGPADLTLKEKDLIALDHGITWFEVPERAVGFQVDTPKFLLTDLGTEFGIISRPGLPEAVHVMQGSVEILNHHGSRQKQTLRARDARRPLPDGGWEKIAYSTKLFFTSLPKTPADSTLFSESFDTPARNRERFETVYPEFKVSGVQGLRVRNGRATIYPSYNLNSFAVATTSGIAGDVIYSVDIGASGSDGRYHAGFQIGPNRIVFHPGFDEEKDGKPLRGAFRVEWPGHSNLNQDMGFIPASDTLHHLEVKQHAASGLFEITITDGDNPANVFTTSFTNPDAVGGDFGIMCAGYMENETATFDNLSVKDAPKPAGTTSPPRGPNAKP